MKGQQLFYSFLPGVTAAVLTSQPALAGAMKVSSVQPASSSNVLTFNGQNLVENNIQTQLPSTADQSFSNLVPNSGLTKLNLKPLSSHTNPAHLLGSTGVFIKPIPKQDKGRFLSLTPAVNLTQEPQQNNSTGDRKQTNLDKSGQGFKKTVANTTSKPLSFLKQTSASQIISETPSPKVLPTAVQGGEAAKLSEVKSCSPQKGNLSSLLLAAKACRESNTLGIKLAQNNTQTSTTTANPESVDFAPNLTQPVIANPTPTEAVQVPNQPGTVSPTPTDSAPVNTQPIITNPVQIPENLTPNPNPLQFPTKTEEVRLQANQPITLAQALEIARQNNRDLQVSLLELRRTQEALREAQAALFPTLGISADITRGQSASGQLQDELTSRAGGRSNNGDPSTNFNGQAQLSYNLYTSGRRQAAIKEAEEQVRFNELAVETRSEEIRLNVTTEYYDLQQADEQVRIAQSAVENAQASLRDAQALERAGVGTRFDVLRSQVNLANSQQDLTNALSQQQIARRRVATRLSLPQSINISAADPVQLSGLWNQSLEQSIVLAYQNRPELQQQLAQRNISEQQRRQALANLGPQVSLVANYNLLDQFDDSVSLTDGYSVGVQATLNLFDGGAARARAAQAKTNIAIAETNFAEQRNQIRFQVEQAYSTQRSNLENVQTSNTALEQAREALRLARLRFQAGVGTQTDVINSENDLTRAEGNRVTAILDYNRALAQLQRAVTIRALR